MKRNQKIALLSALIVLGLVLIATNVMYVKSSRFGSETDRLQMLWQKDLEILESQNKLPESWQSVKEIKYSSGSPVAKAWLNKVKAPIQLVGNGKNRIEIFMDSWREDGKYGVVIQYQTIDLATRNTIHEFGRTLTIGETSATTIVATVSDDTAAATAAASAAATSAPQAAPKK